MASRLFSRNASALIVIDVQDYFLGKLPLDQRAPLVERMGWLITVAGALDIPVIATAEDLSRNGGLTDAIQRLLPAGTIVHDKHVFGLAGQPGLLTAVEATGRTEFVLAGLETDVCIAHSALGLLDRGHRVAVIEDATASPPPHHDAGLRRMAAAGAVITTCKGIHYEWLRDLETLAALRARLAAPPPSSLTL